MFDARFSGLRPTVGEAAYHLVVGGTGPPVVLLHGFPEESPAELLDLLVPFLSA